MYKCVYNKNSKGPIRWDIQCHSTGGKGFMAVANKPCSRAIPLGSVCYYHKSLITTILPEMLAVFKFGCLGPI